MSRIMLSSAAASALILAAVLAGCTEDASPETGAASRLSATEPDRRGPPRDRDHARDGERPNHAERAARREAMHAQMLARFDADHDGSLSADERAAAHRARVGEMIAKLDADGNGTLSSAEFAAQPKRGHRGPDFATLDKSGDGALSLDELVAARPPGPPPGPRPDDADDDGPPPPDAP